MYTMNTSGETYFFDHGFELSDAIFEVRGLIFGVWVHLIDLIDTESGL